jgi:hypothetical protein
VNVLVVLELDREQTRADAIDRRFDGTKAKAMESWSVKAAQRVDRRSPGAEVD